MPGTELHKDIDRLVTPGSWMLGSTRQPSARTALRLLQDLRALARLRGKAVVDISVTDDAFEHERAQQDRRAFLEQVRVNLRMLEGATFGRIAGTASPRVRRDLERAKAGAVEVLRHAAMTLAEFIEEDRPDLSIPDPPGPYPPIAPLPLPSAPR